VDVTISLGNSPYNVTAGQVDSGDVVAGGGTIFVQSGGTAIGTTVSSGGFLEVQNA
jgi:autotransporter passenger strand-loop-strand repeat protein